MASKAGILYVTMARGPSLPNAQFHDWYNNEHGPLRLRLPYVTNGFRYRANDLGSYDQDQPEWMAVYDVTDMNEMAKEQYTRLRKVPVQTQRERDTMKQIKVDRKFYDLVEERSSPDFRPVEELDASEHDKAGELVAQIFNAHSGDDKRHELVNVCLKEIIPTLSKIPGWRRSRVFVSSSIEPRDDVQYLLLSDYVPANDSVKVDSLAAISSTGGTAKSIVEAMVTRTYDLYYTFGPAPRDLAAPSNQEALKSWQYSDNLTATSRLDSSGSAVESYVTTNDGAVLPYRLEGCSKADAPLIVLSNSVLVTWGIWDSFVSQFLSDPRNQDFRILRYHTRGRTSSTGAQDVTIDVLASDIVELLDALRVPKAAAVIGVSLGGITVLNVALQYPQRIGAFLSCDTNAKSPDGNQKAWSDRIAMAEKQGAKSETGEPIVGSDLAEVTVRRWLVKESYDGGSMENGAKRLNAMVESNSLEGFKKGVQALYSYDVREQMKTSTVKGIFVVGAGDGVLPKTMAEMATSYGSGTKLVTVEGAGHLPMVEKPKEFAEAVTQFLAT